MTDGRNYRIKDTALDSAEFVAAPLQPSVSDFHSFQP